MAALTGFAEVVGDALGLALAVLEWLGVAPGHALPYAAGGSTCRSATAAMDA